VQSGWVDDLVDLFNSATVYLYDSADYWRGRGVSEGFGLPPIEALACGCVVFSSLNHALADLLDPGRLGHQIGCGTLDADVEHIAAAVAEPERWRCHEPQLQALLASVSEAGLLERWHMALEQVGQHWRLLDAGAAPLLAPSAWRIRWGSRFDRLRALGIRWRRSAR
jgi:hypothetical protein